MVSSQYEPLSGRDHDAVELLPRIHPADSYDDLNPEHDREHETVTPAGSDVSSSSALTPPLRDERPSIRIEITPDPSSALNRPGPTPLQDDQQEVNNSYESASSKLLIEERLRYSFSPATHHPLKAPSIRSSIVPSDTTSETARVYSYWRQTRRLWRLAAGEWLITATLCIVFGVVLLQYSKKLTISTNQMLQLNTALTVLTFLLGVNLAASMRSYAKMLRWLLLSLCWQPLETFDIILRCDSFFNVCKLVWKIRKQENRRLRWMTQFLATLWILSNIALTLFVGMIGLTYNIDTTAAWLDVALGQTQITDFQALDTGDVISDINAIQAWGLKGFSVDMIYGWGYDLTGDTTIETQSDGQTWYFMSAWNPNDPTMTMIAHVVVGSYASCDVYDVIEGGDGDSEVVSFYLNNGTMWNVTVAYNDQNLPGAGGVVALSQLCDSCESRKTLVSVFVAAMTPDEKAQYFECSNTVSDVFWMDPRNNSAIDYTTAPNEYQFDNYTARMLAGAIGWNGDYDYYVSDNEVWQGMAYQNFSEVGRGLRNFYDGMPSATNMSDFVSTYTVKAMNMIDSRNGGVGEFKEVFGKVPLRAQALSVNWRNAILLLAGIPAMQLIACIMVFMVANKSIIKDDSPLSMAKLYLGLLQKYGLSDKGCLLKGDEIVDYINKASRDPRGAIVTYGWKDTGLDDHVGRPIGHLDVFEEIDEEKEVEEEMGRPGAYTPVKSLMQDLMKVKKVFKDNIKYDGASSGIPRTLDGSVRRRRNSL